MKTHYALILLLFFTSVLVLLGSQMTRAGYESAPYQVVRTDGKFELRDYPALSVVETKMARPNQDADGSFMRLFGFITGRNENKQKISMTTPVFMSGSDADRTMAFVMPASLKPAQIPQPTDDSLKVRELPAGRFAVLRFTGGRSEKLEAATLELLKTWLQEQGLKTSSLPVYGYFDPPWTPPFQRRNEVMLRVNATN